MSALAGSVSLNALESLFHKYDADGSGSIDLSELKAMMRDLGLPVRAARVPWVGAGGDSLRGGDGVGGGCAHLAPSPPTSPPPMQRVSASDLKELMRDVGGEDLAIQLNEFEAFILKVTELGAAQVVSKVAEPVITEEEAGEEEEEEEEDEDEETSHLTPWQIKVRAFTLLCAGVGLVTLFR